MSLSCEEECNRIFWVVYDLVKALKVSEEEVSTLVGSETAAETDCETVRVDTLQELYNASRVTLVTEPYILELNLDIFSELVLELHTCCPELRIWTVVDAMPESLVRLVCEVLLVEVLSIDVSHLCSTPCREVNTVCYISHVVLLWPVASPDRSEHLLRHPSVETRNAIRLLTSVQSEC